MITYLTSQSDDFNTSRANTWHYEAHGIPVLGLLGKIYRICGIIGESNIWRNAQIIQLANILIGGFEYCMERNPYIWRYTRDSPKLRPLPNIPRIR